MARTRQFGRIKRRSSGQKRSIKKARETSLELSIPPPSNEPRNESTNRLVNKEVSQRRTRAQTSAIGTSLAPKTSVSCSNLRRMQVQLDRAILREAKCRASARKLQRNLDSERAQVSALESRLSVLSESLNKTLEAHDAALSLSNLAKRRSLTLKRKVKTDQQHIKRISKSKKSISSDRKSLLGENKKLRDDLELARQESATSASLACALADITEKLATLTTENEILKSNLSTAAIEAGYMRTQLTASRLENSLLVSSNAHNSSRLSDAQQSIKTLQVELHEGKDKLAASKKKRKATTMSLLRRSRAKASLSVSLHKANSFSFRKKGIVTGKARSLLRDVTNLGCPIKNAGKLISQIVDAVAPDCKAAKEAKEISARTVGRAIGEGGIAAHLQMVYEVKNSEGITISGDGTTNRGVNFESQSYTVLAPDSYAKPSAEQVMKHQTRSMGVHSSANHKSETQLHGWMDSWEHNVNLYNKSPLAKGDNLQIAVADIIGKVVGMHSDHAEDQKKLARITAGVKKEFSNETLGRRLLSDMTKEQLLEILDQARHTFIEKLGGIDAWNSLSPQMQRVHTDSYTAEVASQLGEKAYGTMNEEERDKFDLFLWVGCCMHKLLNSVKGAMAEIISSDFYKLLNIDGPLPLPNRDNAATLADPSASSSKTRAAAETQAGGIKLAALMGAYLNNRDDKKGLHDVGLAFIASVVGDKKAWRFPDTNNTRYQSFVDAAAEILARLPIYKELLERTRLLKEKQNFNHMEANIYAGLHDTATIAELIALNFYGEAICYPYTRATRHKDNLNALDLGPLHAKVRAHLRTLIDDPDLILSPSADPKLAVLDGMDWHRVEAINACHDLAKSIPYLRELVVTVFKGALRTWERFSAEFVADGPIATTSVSERLRAYMPATNDANEGALGSYRIFIRMFPTSSVHRFNARFMYLRNGTKGFMELMMSSPDHEKFLRRFWREIDKSKLEPKRKAELVEASEEVLREKEVKNAERAVRKAAATAKVNAVDLVLDEEAIKKLNAKEIQLQLWYLRKLDEDKEIPMVKDSKSKSTGLTALLAAMQRWHERHPNGREEEAARRAARLEGNASGDYEADDDNDVENDADDGFDYEEINYTDDEL